MNTFKKVVLSKTEGILTKFFTAWKNEDWAGMSDACQLSWSNFIKVPAVDRLIEWFGEKKLTAFHLYGGDDLTYQTNKDLEEANQTIRFEAIYRVKVTIEYILYDQKYNARVFVNVISEDGKLGVNPSTILREQNRMEVHSYEYGTL
jgi:hypothetical protein